jgi:RNA polymerase sigma-70 factor, ECF subfamily
VTPEDAFDQYHQAVYSFAYRLTGREDTAEDITQESFLVLVRDPRRFDPSRGSMKTYLFSIARNLALKQYREERLEVLQSDIACIDPAASLPLSSAIAKAVAALPARQQEALILFEYEGFTLEEIARIVGADVGSVKSRLHRARNGLRRTLAPYRGVGNGTV